MYKLHYKLQLPINLEEAWEFFSSPSNLAKITPTDLNFQIIHHHESKKMYAGQLISYTIQPLWKIKLEWVTEIIAVEKPLYFIDEQKFGPYSLWHHEHWFRSIPGGVQMEDLVYYKMPFGILGKAIHYVKVQKDLENIFAHRKEVLEKTFGKYQPIE